MADNPDAGVAPAESHFHPSCRIDRNTRGEGTVLTECEVVLAQCMIRFRATRDFAQQVLCRIPIEFPT